MDRALNVDALATALGDQQGLPAPQELQAMLADAEVQLFRRCGRGGEIPDELLDTAWYLHAIAFVDVAQQRYAVARQRQAFAVSAHVFDVALAEPRWQRPDRLALAFAAAIGYRRGDRDPNATAIFRRFRTDISISEPLLDHIDTLALEAGLALVGFETRTLFNWFRTWQRQLRDLAGLVELEDLSTTAYDDPRRGPWGGGSAALPRSGQPRAVHPGERNPLARDAGPSRTCGGACPMGGLEKLPPAPCGVRTCFPPTYLTRCVTPSHSPTRRC